MSVTFTNAPLVEIVAELKWNRPGAIQPQHGQSVVMQMGTQPSEQEIFFQSFCEKIEGIGFNRLERVLPPGFPALDFQPVYRIKGSDAKLGVLYQVGSGIYSANALPPYISWHEFSPSVASGVSALINSRLPTEKALPFSTLTLRYIDAFRSPLIDPTNVHAFLRDVVGVQLGLPDAILKHARNGGLPRPTLQFSLEIGDNTNLSMTFAESILANEPAIIVDMSVVCTEEIEPDTDAVMARFTAARDVIHNIFVDITKPLHALMKPNNS